MKFKNTVSPDAMFHFKGANHRCTDYIFETDNAEIIEFLKGNFNFEAIEVIDEPKKGK